MERKSDIMEFEEIVQEKQQKTGKISKADFKTISVIGKGSYGQVLLVKKVDNGDLYALKVLKKQEIQKRNQVEHTMAERRILALVKHPFIVKMDYAFQSHSMLFFALEYCPGGELFFYLSQIGRFREEAARFYASNILLALEYLHSKNILYRDLKPENVLMDFDGYLKLTDFGLSKENIDQNNNTKSICGTAEYLSPEILNMTGHGKASDWWSFGAIIYELLYGIPPFYSKDKKQMYQNIRFQEPKFDLQHLSSEAKDLCYNLLQKDPKARLGGGARDAQEIKEHPWFSNINWEEIEKKQIKPPYKPELDSKYDLKHFEEMFTKMKFSLQDSQQEEQGYLPNFTYEDQSM